jgi:disulfide bond formation protein DsbB
VTAVGESKFGTAHWLAFLLPAGLLAGAYASQYLGGLYPCEMCWWQRYPHFEAVALAFVAFFVRVPPYRHALVALAALGILSSGLIGGFHAGVEYGWWEGLTACTSTISGTGDELLKSIMNAPLIRCDVAPWTLFGISLAGYNFLLSTGGAIAILVMIWKSPKS